MKISIRYKFILGFIVIFLISFAVMQYFMKNSIENNIEKTINIELLDLKEKTILYLNKYFINKNNIDSKVFNNDAQSLTDTLCDKLQSRVIAYSIDGKLLSDSINEEGNLFVQGSKRFSNEIINTNYDLNLAIDNKTAYTINPLGDMYIINYSFPAQINNKTIGIIRVSKDYSELYNDNYKLLRQMDLTILCILLFTFIFSYLFTEKIIVPIFKLNEAADKISKGNYDFVIENKGNDEIGQLTNSFSNMKNKIAGQIEEIIEERDKIIQLERYRKEFFDNATHEMKTPLTVISGYAQILENKGFEDKVFFERAIRNIKTECERMHGFVIQLLSMSKLASEGEKDFLKVNITEIISDITNAMEIKAKKYSIDIKAYLKTDIFVLGNIDSLKQVFINIIDNSIKYGNTNSTITIEVLKDKDYCYIIIKDKGIGIPEEKLEKVFEPFYRASTENSRDSESFGLGLTIVKNILDSHNAQISINSEIGVGTEVRIKIPLYDNILATFP